MVNNKFNLVLIGLCVGRNYDFSLLLHIIYYIISPTICYLNECKFSQLKHSQGIFILYYYILKDENIIVSCFNIERMYRGV